MWKKTLWILNRTGLIWNGTTKSFSTKGIKSQSSSSVPAFVYHGTVEDLENLSDKKYYEIFLITLNKYNSLILCRKMFQRITGQNCKTCLFNVLFIWFKFYPVFRLILIFMKYVSIRSLTDSDSQILTPAYYHNL